MSNHTPGPWSATDTGMIHDKDEINIAQCGIANREGKANLQLILKAPEMYAALKVALDAFNRIPNHPLGVAHEYGEIKDSYYLAFLLGQLLREIEA